MSPNFTNDNLGDHTAVFCQMWDWHLCSYCSASVAPLNCPMEAFFLPCVFLIVESWTLSFTQVNELCMTSLITHQCGTVGKIFYCSMFPPFVSHEVPKCLRDSFVTFLDNHWICFRCVYNSKFWDLLAYFMSSEWFYLSYFFILN